MASLATVSPTGGFEFRNALIEIVRAINTNGLALTSIATSLASLGTYTVAGLPSAASSGQGARAFVSDSDTPTFGDVAVGGGSLYLPIFSDGTAWRWG